VTLLISASQVAENIGVNHCVRQHFFLLEGICHFYLKNKITYSNSYYGIFTYHLGDAGGDVGFGGIQGAL
jgi:hypothetical protein